MLFEIYKTAGHPDSGDTERLGDIYAANERDALNAARMLYRCEPPYQLWVNMAREQPQATVHR